MTTEPSIIGRIKNTVYTPFLGSDESWREKYGDNWEQAKENYITLCAEKVGALKQRLESKVNHSTN